MESTRQCFEAVFKYQEAHTLDIKKGKFYPSDCHYRHLNFVTLKLVLTLSLPFCSYFRLDRASIDWYISPICTCIATSRSREGVPNGRGPMIVYAQNANFSLFSVASLAIHFKLYFDRNRNKTCLNDFYFNSQHFQWFATPHTPLTKCTPRILETPLNYSRCQLHS